MLTETFVIFGQIFFDTGVHYTALLFFEYSKICATSLFVSLRFLLTFADAAAFTTPYRLASSILSGQFGYNVAKTHRNFGQF